MIGNRKIVSASEKMCSSIGWLVLEAEAEAQRIDRQTYRQIQQRFCHLLVPTARSRSQTLFQLVIQG